MRLVSGPEKDGLRVVGSISETVDSMAEEDHTLQGGGNQQRGGRNEVWTGDSDSDSEQGTKSRDGAKSREQECASRGSVFAKGV